jgi:hypothetical protein
MRNTLAKLGIKALVLLAIAVHWVLDDVIIFLPTVAVDAISQYVFKMTGNGYRFEKWLDFWNEEKPEEE